MFVILFLVSCSTIDINSKKRAKLRVFFCLYKCYAFFVNHYMLAVRCAHDNDGLRRVNHYV